MEAFGWAIQKRCQRAINDNELIRTLRFRLISRIKYRMKLDGSIQCDTKHYYAEYRYIGTGSSNNNRFVYTDFSPFLWDLKVWQHSMISFKNKFFLTQHDFLIKDNNLYFFYQGFNTYLCTYIITLMFVFRMK